MRVFHRPWPGITLVFLVVSTRSTRGELSFEVLHGFAGPIARPPATPTATVGCDRRRATTHVSLPWKRSAAATISGMRHGRRRGRLRDAARKLSVVDQSIMPGAVRARIAAV